MSEEFIYKYIGKCVFGEVYRPVAEVTFYCKGNSLPLSLWMVVDSGADYSILPRYMADKLGISLTKDCTSDMTSGVGGQKKTYFLKEKVKAKLGKISKEVPIAFIDSNEVPPLLGRLGFMELFEIVFDGNKKVVFKEIR